jgi:ornithine cyclodeaminase/alanine dehydrogenase-like protein (mu-crystallin family)
VSSRVDLAAAALRALGRGTAEMPPKIGVHPRPGALVHAMPAWLREGDLVGLKWVAAFPDNKRLGLPAINGLVVLNDAETGLPTWIMEAGRITAVRTAAVSGVAIRLYTPDARQVALLGAGVQARSHLEVMAELLPNASVELYDRHSERAEAVADEANLAAGREWVSAVDDARGAVRRAGLVVTAASMGGASQQMDDDWLADGSVVVAVDFATYASATLARAARAFVVDDRAQFLFYRDGGSFDGYPEPTTTLGEVLDAGDPTVSAAADDARSVLVTHLGVGLADVLFADAVARQAQAMARGVELVR